jgi:DNA polymerase family B
MGDYIQVNRMLQGRGDHPNPMISYTFLMHSGFIPPTIAQRWDDMANRIRQGYAQLAALQHIQNPRFILHVIPGGPIPYHTARFFANIDAITGERLSDIYKDLLQSDETIQMEGLTIELSLAGVDMPNRNASGRGRGLGFKLIPPHLKHKGLIVHPQTEHYQQELDQLGLCGPMAILLARYTERYKKDFPLLLEQSKSLAEEIGITNTGMKKSDTNKIIQLPGWEFSRIIIFSILGRKSYEAIGEHWHWPDQPRTQADPNTICILFDPSEKHYWTVEGVTSLCFTGKGGKFVAGDTRKDCYHCFFKSYNHEKFDSHNCIGARLHQCQICKDFFSKEGLDRHYTLLRKDLHCDCCQKRLFNGQECYDKHLEDNCHEPSHQIKKKCQECNRPYLENKPHTCNFGKCRHCDHVFNGQQDYKSHRCYLTRLKKFYNDEETENETKKWESHWFYDFETCRGEETVPGYFRHEVMAWAIQLIVPDTQTRLLINENEWLDLITLKIEDKIKERYDDVKYKLIEHPMGDTILIYGKQLESFIEICSKILCMNSWKPTLWAHNGSKFDAKFILDYYLNHLGYDLGGSVYEETEPENYRVSAHPKRKEVCNVIGIGCKILALYVDNLKFQCSHAHFTMPLRSIPSVFGLEALIEKGEFPYGRLSHTAWGTQHENGLPPLKEYEPDANVLKRRTELITWWTNEQMRRHVSKQDIFAELDKYKDTEAQKQLLSHYTSTMAPTPWDFTSECWKYLFEDVNVGARCMEKYHQTSVTLHEPIWHHHPELQGKLVSPLGYATAPGWANAIYRTWFVPENTCAILRAGPEATFIRDSLRGGRTDKRANIVTLTPERFAAGDRIKYVDFKSLYPSVQKSEIHDTHFPVNAPEWIKQPTLQQIQNWDYSTPYLGGVDNEILCNFMRNKTGFLRVDTKVKKYVTHPTLHRVGKVDDLDNSNKLLFENKDHKKQVYAWPELEEAIRTGEIEVMMLHEGLLFDRGTNVFNGYVDFFFKVKQDAELQGNSGLRELAKLLLNSLWGKLGQRSYSIREWVQDETRLDFLIKQFDNGNFQLINIENRETFRVYVQYRKKEDFNNLSNTNYQLAAYVSMWGRVTLHKKMLSVHGQRMVYSDTDSGVVYVRAGDTIPYMGDNIGDLTDEVPKLVKGMGFIEPYIQEAVFVAPKTYALKIKDAQSDREYCKVVCKGFESSYAAAVTINYEAMKELVNDKYNITKRRAPDNSLLPLRKRIQGAPRLSFRSIMSTNDIVPVELSITKNMSGEYNKGKIHPTDKRLIIPYGDWEPAGSFLDFEKVNDKFIDYE